MTNSFIHFISISFILFLSSGQPSFAQQLNEEQMMDSIAKTITSIEEIKTDDGFIKYPTSKNNYKIKLVGTDNLSIINGAGAITKPLVDTDVNLYFQLTNRYSTIAVDIPNIKVSVPGMYPKEVSDNPSPNIIPSVREWKGKKGFLNIKSEGKIAIKELKRNELIDLAERLADDMSSIGDYSYDLSQIASDKAFIIMKIDTNENNFGREGYRLTIDNDIRLVANHEEGLFWGTRTILQLLDVYGNNIPKGIIRDYPKYKRRGFMLDVGRKFFSLDYLKNYIKILSYYKMNEFQIHLNDNGFKQYFDNDWNKTYSAFRLESASFPELTAKDGSYSKEDFRALQRMGQKYGVNIIPEIDIPAHSLAFSKFNPSIASQEFGIDHIDINNPETYTFLDRLFHEYLGGESPVFIGTDVHIGTDEYDKKEAESFRKFTDYYLKKMQSYGKRARMWGSLTHAKGETPVTSQNVIMNAWYNGYANPKDMIDQGYELISTSDRHLYIVPAAGYYYDYLNLKFLLNTWEPNIIGDQVFPFGHPSISGGMFAVWNDHCGNGISQKDVHHRAFPALQVLAQKMWFGKNDSLTLPDFEKRASLLQEAPEVNMMGKVKHKGDMIVSYDFTESAYQDYSLNNFDLIFSENPKWIEGKGLQFNKKSVVTSPIEEIGYNYKVEFEITFGEIDGKSNIFESENALFFVKPNNDILQLGFARDGYTFTFKAPFKKEETYVLSIEGNNKSVALYVNGKPIETLAVVEKEFKKENGAISKMYYQHTLVFPLKKIGGFNGIIHQLKVKSNH